MINKSIKPDDSGVLKLGDLAKITRIILRNWYIVVLLIIITLSAYLVYLFLNPEKAVAKMQLAVNHGESGINLSNDISALYSPSLISQTIDDLNMDVAYFKKDKKGNVKEFTQRLPFKVRLGIISQELKEKFIKLKILNESTYELSYTIDEEIITKQALFDSAFVTTDVKLEIAKSDNFNMNDLKKIENSDYFIQIHDKPTLIKQCQSMLIAEMAEDNGVLNIMYKDFLPQKAIAFIDTLSKKFLNNASINQIDRNNRMIAGINKLLRGTEITLKSIEDSLRKYKGITGSFNESIEDQKYVAVITNLMLEKKKLEMKQSASKELEKYIIENKDPMDFPPPYSGDIEDPFIRKSIDELYHIQLTKKEGLFEVTDKNTNIDKIDKNYEFLKSSLLKYIKASEGTLNEKIIRLDKQINEVSPSHEEYSQEQIHVLELERQLKVNETMYMSLLDKRNNLVIAQSTMSPEYRVLETAHLMEQKSRLNEKAFLYLIAIAVVLSMIIIYIKNFFYGYIESIEELREKTSIPFVGEMPTIKKTTNEERINFSGNIYTNPLAMSLLRGIRTNMEFVLSGEKSKVILITSHTSGEGKTFNSVNLASILAIAKRKVLLLDMDLYKPNIANTLGINSDKKGINAIYQKTSSIADNILKTKTENLDVVIAESPAKDASEMILSDTTKEIIDYGKENYDYVIIDTPPIGLASDTLLLMEHSDINIYVLNASSPYRGAINQARDIVKKNKFKLFFLLNKVHTKRLQYYSKQYKNYRYAYAS